MIILYMTASTLKEAEKISNILLKKKLIACANIVKSNSIYKWKNKVVHENEFIIYYKTNQNKVVEAERIIKKIHSYECPCIIQIPVKSNAEYNSWVKSQLKNP